MNYFRQTLRDRVYRSRIQGIIKWLTAERREIAHCLYTAEYKLLNKLLDKSFLNTFSCVIRHNFCHHVFNIAVHLYTLYICMRFEYAHIE